MEDSYSSKFQEVLKTQNGAFKDPNSLLKQQPSEKYLEKVSEKVPDFKGLPTNQKANWEQFGLCAISSSPSSYASSSSFGAHYLSLYSGDNKILITTDSILYAWHKTYDSILKELEITFLIPQLTTILKDLFVEASKMKLTEKSPLSASLQDVQIYLSVALNLISGFNVPGAADLQQTRYGGYKDSSKKAEPVNSPKEIKAKVDSLLALIEKASSVEKINLFGRDVPTDFSQFKPRGHYAKDAKLMAYFACMMWLGRFSFVIEDKPASMIGAVALLHQLMMDTKSFDSWKNFDQVIQVFVGKSDNITFAHLNDTMKAAKISEVKTSEELLNLQKYLLENPALKQEYSSGVDIASNPKSGAPETKPVIFAFLGQRFCMDGWAISQVTHDRIVVDGKTVPRRMVSCLDVAFSVFGNHAVVSDIVERMTKSPKDVPKHLQWRDGLNYADNLMAVKSVIDSLPPSRWEESLYTLWLSCLRTLSDPTTHPLLYPQSMQTQAYAKKNLATQLGSYTQLKRDTILYAKQPTMGMCGCDVPHGFVEPKIAFWKQMIKMIEKTQLLVKSINSSAAKETLKSVDSCLVYFKETVETLLQISIKEINKDVLNPEESFWIRQVVESKVGGSGMGSNTGWYYGLFYHKSVYTSGRIVADIASSYDDPMLGAPGQVLNLGLSNVHLLAMFVDHVGHSTNSSLPGKGLSVEERRKELSGKGFGYRPPPPKKPSNVSSGEKVPGWEKMPKFVSDSGEFLKIEEGLKVPVCDVSAKGVFMGPVFAFREFITGQAQRMNDSEWKKVIHPKPPSYLVPYYLAADCEESPAFDPKAAKIPEKKPLW